MEFSEYKASVLSDTRSIQELIRDALMDDEEFSHRAIVVLHCKGSREVLEAAVQLSKSKLSKERTLAAVVLAQIGVPDRTFPRESFDALADMLRIEEDEDVLATIAASFNFLDDPEKVGLLVPLSHHPNSDIRYGVVLGLLRSREQAAVRVLIILSRDEDDDVRDWATFGLGSQLDLDTPAIRDALWERIRDENDDVRGEALVGLAERKDLRIVEPLIDELQSGSIGVLALEAAREIADVRLVPALSELQESWSEDNDRHSQLLSEAIAACMPDVRPVQ